MEPAIAGGTGLATLCDFTLAAPQAKFGYTEVRIGFIPAIVSVFLLEMIGEKKAKALLLSGRILDAEEALSMGLVTEVVPEGELIARVQFPGSAVAEEQSGIDECGQETAELLCQGTPRSRSGTGDAVERKDPQQRGFPRGITGISGKTRPGVAEAQAEVDHPVKAADRRFFAENSSSLQWKCYGMISGYAK